MNLYLLTTGIPFTRPQEAGYKEPALLIGLRVTAIALGVIAMIAAASALIRTPNLTLTRKIVGGLSLFFSFHLIQIASLYRVVKRVPELSKPPEEVPPKITKAPPQVKSRNILQMNVSEILNLEKLGELEKSELKAALVIAAREDSVELAEAMLKYAPEVLAFDRSRALNTAIARRSFNVLPLIIKAVQSRNWEGVDYDIEKRIEGAFKQKDKELLSALCKNIDSEMRFQLFFRFCPTKDSDMGSLKMLRKVIDVEEMRHKSENYFEECASRGKAHGFEWFWQLAEFFLDQGATPFNAAIAAMPCDTQTKYFEKLCARKVLHSPIPEKERCLEALDKFLDYAKEHGYLNQPDANGDTPLHCAIRNQAGYLISSLARIGADLTLRNNLGRPPVQELSEVFSPVDLGKVFSFSSTEQQIQGIEELLRLGREGDLIAVWECCHRDLGLQGYMIPWLHSALEKGMWSLSSLLVHSLSLTLADAFFESAKKSGLEEQLRECCFEEKGRLFFEKMTTAVMHGNAKAIGHFFAAGIKPGKNDVLSFYDLLRAAIYFEKVSSVEALLKLERDYPNEAKEALGLACRNSASKELVTFLLHHGYDPREEMDPYAAIHWAAREGSEEAIYALAEYDPSLISLPTTDEKLTPLDLAVRDQKLKAARALRALGADLSSVDPQGNTYLHLIAQSHFDSIEAKGLFLQALALGSKSDERVNNDHLYFWDYFTDEEWAHCAQFFPTISYTSKSTDIISSAPQELREAIFEHLTPAALANVTLVCKEWYSFSAREVDRKRFAFEIRNLSTSIARAFFEKAAAVYPCFDPEMGWERKSWQLISYVQKGANPKAVKESERTYFWQRMSEAELQVHKRAFERCDIPVVQETAALMVKSAFPKDFISELPEDVPTIIFNELSLGDLKGVRLVSKQWYVHANRSIASQFALDGRASTLHSAAQCSFIDLGPKPGLKGHILDVLAHWGHNLFALDEAGKFFWQYLEDAEKEYWRNECQLRLELAE